MTNIAIIGAGIAGLAAASKLRAEANVVLFDKSWRAGGRATTRERPRQFDHGAQYFTVKSTEFKDFLAPFIERELVKPWRARYAEINRNEVIKRSSWAEHNPRFVAVPGMTHLGQTIASQFKIHFETRITAIQQFDNQWQLTSHDDEIGIFDWVILAIPSPQALQLMPDCFSEMDAIRQARMRACFTLMLGFDELPDPGFDAASVLDADISWIAANHSKPGRPAEPTLLVHSSNEWAENHLDMGRDAVISHLIKTTESTLNRSLSNINHRDVHRWLYADVQTAAGQPALVDNDNRLAAIGDWCLSGRVESAFQSGIALADILNEPD